MLPYLPTELQEINDTPATIAVELSYGQTASFPIPRGATFVELYATQPVFIKKEDAPTSANLFNALAAASLTPVQFWFMEPITGTTNTGLDTSKNYTFSLAGHVYTIAGSASQTLTDLMTAIQAIVDPNSAWVLKNAYGITRTTTDTDIVYIEASYPNGPGAYLLPIDGTLWQSLVFFKEPIVVDPAQVVEPRSVGELLLPNVTVVKRLNPTQEFIGITTTHGSGFALVSASFFTTSC